MWYKVPNASKYSINRETLDVRNDKTGRILRAVANNCGYIHVCLIHDDKKARTSYIHRIVAELFLPRPEGATIVNHRNFVKSDNSESNLEWTTYSENTKHFWDQSTAEAAKEFRKRWAKDELKFIRLMAKLHRKFKKVNTEQRQCMIEHLEQIS